MRREIIGNSILYLGDCCEILPTLERVDSVITDPPYENEAHTKSRRTMGGNGLENNTLEFGAMTSEVRYLVAKESVRLARRWIMFFCQAEGINLWRDATTEAGGRYVRPMIWVKPDGLPQYSGDRPAMGYESICLCHSEEKMSWNGGGRHGVFIMPKGIDGQKPVHQTQKPIRLMKELVSLFTNPDEIILDPFMGSGSTGVACVMMGRHFIGIEKEEKHFDSACRRIEEAYQQPDMLVEAKEAIWTQSSLGCLDSTTEK